MGYDSGRGVQDGLAIPVGELRLSTVRRKAGSNWRWMLRAALACLLAMSAPTSYAAPPLARLAHAEALVPAGDATEPQAY
ncbi:MAG: hypothetical protein L6Q83_12035, partial [Gammaproteobacteria bacterium]|nr:hypothetical protein [Gammaproteobacteria bacterium]